MIIWALIPTLSLCPMIPPPSNSYTALPTTEAAPNEDTPSEPLLLSRRGITRSVSYRGSVTVHPDGQGYSYSYGPSGLSGLLNNYYALGCSVFASIGGAAFGYEQGVIANVLVMKDFTERWPIGAWEKGLMSASYLFSVIYTVIMRVVFHSGCFGTRSVIWCSHCWYICRQILPSAIYICFLWYGLPFTSLMQCSLCVGEVIFCIGSGLQCAAHSLSELILGRAIGGFGVGALR